VLKQIHMHTANMRANAKDGGARPVWVVRDGDRFTYCQRVLFYGATTTIYRPEAPLSGGVVGWVETAADVKLVDAERPTDGAYDRPAKKEVA
jgi:hypothetical protein